ncbi:hypothetical protein PHJA_000214200 [Phtheirospermum japonicum]|uniref:Uncharacterized protein n=1 Tax=Phtheirospermum japonicum TaxID=374723 RepID=A0A830B5X1_9LAMI|nr:hypothetical protein PHJA_000214200 [Phtheirospermum japonicum]
MLNKTLLTITFELRNLCKTYGVRTFIDPENARDSLYRASVNLVLDYCESISNDTTSIEINGENVREFIAGIADNIGLESPHAARMVTAAVAARTRSRILQAWALEVQNKHAEALVELFNVCLIHRIFPPEENSVCLRLLFALQTLFKCLFSWYEYLLLRLCTVIVSYSYGPVLSHSAFTDES